jgi:hypothetical protein
VAAGIFLGSALLIHVLNRQSSSESAFGDSQPSIENVAPPAVPPGESK